MRRVSLFGALAFSLVAISLSTPSFAVSDGKERLDDFSFFMRAPSANAVVMPAGSAAYGKHTSQRYVGSAAHKRAIFAEPVAGKPSAVKRPTAKKALPHAASNATASTMPTMYPLYPQEGYYAPEYAQTAVAARPAKQNVHRARVASTETASSGRGNRFPSMFASSDIVMEARRWIGTNPTTRDTLWCARFMNFVLERSGYQGTGSDAAKSFASYGRRVSGPQIGAIAVMTRGKNGGHVGVVTGIDPKTGNPIVISGNHNKTVGVGVYPRSRIYAYVKPI